MYSMCVADVPEEMFGVYGNWEVLPDFRNAQHGINVYNAALDKEAMEAIIYDLMTSKDSPVWNRMGGSEHRLQYGMKNLV